MSSDKQQQSLSEVWSERYDDRDDVELACHVWAQSLARRDQAMAHPIKAFELTDEKAPNPDRSAAAKESKST
jgi:hypothetical protein